MKTDLQLAKTVKLRKNTMRRATRSSFFDIASCCNVISGNLVRQQVFVIQNFLFRVPFTVAAKTFRAALDFINAHLLQLDQVLRTVDFWLIVCGDTRVLTVATT